MIRVPFRIPAVALESMARSVYFMLFMRIASGMPGTILSVTSIVASGVMSRFEKPVPPVVRMSSASPSSATRRISAARRSRSSGSIL